MRAIVLLTVIVATLSSDQLQAQAVIDFDAVSVTSGQCTGASAYLASFGISFVPVTSGAIGIICNATGTAAIAASAPNVFYGAPPVTNTDVSYDLMFSAPVEELRFTRAAISPLTAIPAWSASAYDDAGTLLSSVAQGLRYPGPPAESFTLTGPGITRVRVNAYNSAHVTFNHPPFDDVVVTLTAQTGPTLVSTRFAGGPGDQHGQAVTTAAGKIFAVGQGGEFVTFAAPPAEPTTTLVRSGWIFLGITSTPTRVYPVGEAFPPHCGTSDGVGDGEPKSIVPVVDAATEEFLSCSTSNFFSYRGYEGYGAAAFDGVKLFAVGGGESSWGGGIIVLAEVDPDTGAVIAKVTEPGVEFDSYTHIGRSGAFGLTPLNGSLYVAGFSKLTGEDGFDRPVLMRYTQALVREWKVRSTDRLGSFTGLAALGDYLYAVGYANVGSDQHYLIEKYDQAGSRIWSRQSSGAGRSALQGITVVGDRLFAAGYTNASGSGGYDALLVEIDPATGDTVFTTTFGGPQEDVANSVTADGTDIYVLGYSRSFASPAGNSVGESDMMLLHYAIGSTEDAVAPSANPVQWPGANAAGWNNGEVVVTWNWADNIGGAGIDEANCPGSVTSSVEGGSISLTATCEDLVGNVGSASYHLKVDATPPTISAAATASPNGAGWYNVDVIVAFACADGLSGITSCPGSETLTGEGAAVASFPGVAVDVADNASAPSNVVTVMIDKTPPEVSLNGGPAEGGMYYFGSVPLTPACEASDALSGLAANCTVAGYSAAVGSHHVIASAVDRAGNLATASASYTVLPLTPRGFYAPVDMGDVWNSVKGGATVPLKFEAFAGSVELTSTSFVNQPLTATRAPCSGGPTEEVELVAAGETTLRYDAADGQFVYNWKTPKRPGYCYVVTVTLADGSSISANFMLK
jgi:hypothetical protein